MSDRERILEELRRVPVPEVALPEIAGAWAPCADTPCADTPCAGPVRQFRDVLEAVGGRAIEVGGPSELAEALAGIESVARANHLWSLVPGVGSRGGPWERVTDAHDLESLECCLAAGEFGVAENGAVWIAPQTVTQRAALVIAQHLALVVPATRIVPQMHEAYARISWDAARFGVFISGPSKTADIEQSLVIGAHGARSLTVVLVGEA
jgi:L-lactate dehydrogenase complex protein LldG